MIFIKIIIFLPKIGPLWAHKGPMGIPRKLELSFGEGCIFYKTCLSWPGSNSQSNIATGPKYCNGCSRCSTCNGSKTLQRVQHLQRVQNIATAISLAKNLQRVQVCQRVQHLQRIQIFKYSQCSNMSELIYSSNLIKQIFSNILNKHFVGQKL